MTFNKDRFIQIIPSIFFVLTFLISFLVFSNTTNATHGTPAIEFTASDTNVNPGDNVTLTWSAPSALSCTPTFSSNTFNSGSAVVSPLSTTEYSVTCSSSAPGGSCSTYYNDEAACNANGCIFISNIECGGGSFGNASCSSCTGSPSLQYNTESLTVTVNPPSPPALASIGDINFGQRTIGGGPYDIPVSIENTGGTDTVINVTGLLAPFSCFGSGCNNYTLPANGGNVIVNILYDPAAPAGDETTQTVEVTCTGGCASETFTVDGEGTAAIPSAPTVIFDPPPNPSINYGSSHNIYWTTNAAVVDCDIKRVTDNVDFFNEGTSGPYNTGARFADTEYAVRCENSAAVSTGWTTGADNVNVAINPTYTLTVNSVGASNVVMTGAQGGTSNYSIPNLVSGTNAVMTAPDTSGGQNFSSWSNCASGAGNRTCTVNMMSNVTVTANYTAPPPPPTATLEGRFYDGSSWSSWGSSDIDIVDTYLVEMRWTSTDATLGCAGNANLSTGNAAQNPTYPNGIGVTTPTPGNSTTYEITCTGPGGSIPASIDVNKLLQPNLTISLPADTLSTDDDPSFFNPATGEYNYITVTYQIQASDNDVTAAFDTIFDIDMDGPGPLGYTNAQSVNLASLSSGSANAENGTVIFTNVPFGVGATVRARTDSGNVIAESSDSDNQATRQVGLTPPNIDMNLILDPSDLVRGGEDVDIEYDTNASFPMSCSLSGPALATITFDPSDTPVDIDGPVWAGPIGETSAGPILSKSQYTLECLVPNPADPNAPNPTAGLTLPPIGTYTESVSIETTGFVEEI